MKQNLQYSELLFIGLTTGILLILFVPIPSGLLDLLLIINFSWALTILLLTFHTEKPLDFSTFPTLLLISTLFRLALNISATRLILADATAGQVIKAVGQYVIQGNYVLGLVVFLILIIVQFMVVTNGAQRVAEVAARFTLDSMPGKQMSIDADLNAGSINLDEAKKRRAQIEREANFYGAMDGASKFVKGDAIAGILIMLVNILGGFLFGMIQKGMTLSEALQTYTLLTIGDGLVTQIPALVISTATGIIVTRAATDAQLGQEVKRQVMAYPGSLLIVCVALAGLLFIKTIPVFPILLVLIGCGIAALIAMKNQQAPSIPAEEKNLYDALKIYPVEIQLHPTLFNNLQTNHHQVLEAIQQIREKLALDLGFVIPEIKLKSEASLAYPDYQISIQGNVLNQYALHLDKILVLQSVENTLDQFPEGIAVTEPCYGLPAMWINLAARHLAQKKGLTICEPLQVLITHLQETLYQHLPQLLGRQETRDLLAQDTINGLSEELVPALLSYSQVQRILQNLLQEKVSLRPLTSILEVLLEHAKQIPDTAMLTELVRAALATSLCKKLLDKENTLQVLTLEGALEQSFLQQIHKDKLALSPVDTENLLRTLFTEVEHMIRAQKQPVLLCAPLLRRPLRQLTQRIMPHLTVLSMNEIPIHIPVQAFGLIRQSSNLIPQETP